MDVGLTLLFIILPVFVAGWIIGFEYGREDEQKRHSLPR